MKPAQNPRKSFHFPFFQGILPLNPKQVPLEITAGITFAAFAIPEVMGYTKIAGMPLVTGIYTILLPMVAFAIFGSSRHLVVGADSATAAIIASGLVTIAAPESSSICCICEYDCSACSNLASPCRLATTGFSCRLSLSYGSDRISYRCWYLSSLSHSLAGCLGYPQGHMEHLCRSLSLFRRPISYKYSHTPGLIICNRDDCS